MVHSVVWLSFITYHQNKTTFEKEANEEDLNSVYHVLSKVVWSNETDLLNRRDFFFIFKHGWAVPVDSCDSTVMNFFSHVTPFPHTRSGVCRNLECFVALDWNFQVSTSNFNLHQIPSPWRRRLRKQPHPYRKANSDRISPNEAHTR